MVTWVAFLHGMVRSQVVDGQTFPNTEGSYEYVEQARQCTYKRNIEARSRNHCCRGKAVSITYSQGVFVALVVQHAKRMRRIILSSVVCLATIFFHIISQIARFSRKKKLLIIKMCFDFLYNFCLKHFPL
jgi:hypothetical protein